MAMPVAIPKILSPVWPVFRWARAGPTRQAEDGPDRGRFQPALNTISL